MTSNFQKLHQQIQSTFSSNTKLLRTTLRKGKKQGRIRDLVQQRSLSSSNMTSFSQGKKKLGLKIRNTGKKKPKRRANTSLKKEKKAGYSGPFLHYEVQNMKNEQQLNIDLKDTKLKFKKAEEALRKEGIRIYPIHEDFDYEVKQQPNLITNHSPVIKTVIRQELLEDKRNPDVIDDDEVFNSHKKGPLVRSHAINNPVLYHEKKMRSRVLKAMNF